MLSECGRYQVLEIVPAVLLQLATLQYQWLQMPQAWALRYLRVWASAQGAQAYSVLKGVETGVPQLVQIGMRALRKSPKVSGVVEEVRTAGTSLDQHIHPVTCLPG
jgi:hypothetical protein